MSINFRTKFKDKIRYVHKTGLTDTLLADRPNNDHLRQATTLEVQQPDSLNKRPGYSLSPLKNSRRCTTIENHESKPPKFFNPSHAQNSKSNGFHESEPSSPLLHLKQTKVSNSAFFSKIEQNKSKYIDDMLLKHSNLIRMIDYKTKWREKGTLASYSQALEPTTSTVFTQQQQESPKNSLSSKTGRSNLFFSPSKKNIPIKFE